MKSDSPIDQYTHTMTLSPSGEPDQGFSVQWLRDLKVFRFAATFEIAQVLRDLAAKGYIEIKKPLEGEDHYQTMSFDYPIRDEQTLRVFAFGNSTSLSSLLMGIASDLAKEAKQLGVDQPPIPRPALGLLQRQGEL
jgi:hypothetical protein